MSVGAICLCACTLTAADDRRAEFRADSDLVLVPVSVTDSAHRSVLGLERSAFRVFDDKAEQKVLQFAREDAPVSIGIVFDSSGSMKDKLRKSREAVDQFLAKANPEDEFFLVEFSDEASMTVPFTRDADEIRDRLRQAEPHGKTALLDAVMLAMHSMKTARHTRRALLILSDGGDNDSRYTQAEMRKRLHESDLWIYAMGIYDGGTAFLPEQAGMGQDLLQSLASETGGRHYAVENARELPPVAARIGLELRNQYVLGYRPSNPRNDYHHVQVKVVEGRDMNVSWRPGYFGK